MCLSVCVSVVVCVSVCGAGMTIYKCVWAGTRVSVLGGVTMHVSMCINESESMCV